MRKLFQVSRVVFAVLAIAAQHWQILREEEFLKQRYGEPYERYRKKTPRYLLCEECHPQITQIPQIHKSTLLGVFSFNLCNLRNLWMILFFLCVLCG